MVLWSVEVIQLTIMLPLGRATTVGAAVAARPSGAGAAVVAMVSLPLVLWFQGRLSRCPVVLIAEQAGVTAGAEFGDVGCILLLRDDLDPEEHLGMVFAAKFRAFAVKITGPAGDDVDVAVQLAGPWIQVAFL
jgi:hypothetical protein